MTLNCKFCNQTNFSKINTYKSIYIFCNNFQCSTRITKNKAPLEFLGKFLNLIGFKKISNFFIIRKINENYIGNAIFNPY